MNDTAEVIEKDEDSFLDYLEALARKVKAEGKEVPAGPVRPRSRM